MPSNAAAPAGPRRTHMRDKIWIGTWWERRSDRALFQVRNVWRADRRAQMAPDLAADPLITVTFDDLRRRWRQVAR